ncbi:MAG: thioredoxin family protein [Thermoanaerobaculia bacterium]
MKRLRLRALLPAILFGAFAGALTADASEGVLPWVENDYPKALAEARARNVPIFLEAWAPWCHSCRSMQAYVYTDRRLAPWAAKFVWLSVDTENKVNAATIAKYPVGAWPSMYVIDPQTEKADFRWTGSATVEQLRNFLDETEGSAGPAKSAGADGADPLRVALGRADALYGAASWDAAATAYASVLAHAPADWKLAPRAADAYLFSLIRADRTAECARAARELLPRMGATPSSATVASMGLDCAVELAADAPERSATIAALERATRSAIDHPPAGLAVDDLSGLYISLITARDAAGDEEGKSRLVREWIALLDGAAAKAETPTARAVFDSHRLSAYLEAGEPERAVPMLEASERDFPRDYNPPARLAIAYRAMKKPDLALKAADRALELAYGPRRLGILRNRAKILEEKGDRTGARATLAAAIAEGDALPEAQRSERMMTALRKELEALSSPPAAS